VFVRVSNVSDVLPARNPTSNVAVTVEPTVPLSYTIVPKLSFTLRRTQPGQLVLANVIQTLNELPEFVLIEGSLIATLLNPVTSPLPDSLVNEYFTLLLATTIATLSLAEVILPLLSIVALSRL
jgi:hypothetical protein